MNLVLAEVVKNSKNVAVVKAYMIKKEMGVQPSDEPRSCTPVLCYEKCAKMNLFPCISVKP